ncbi:MAG TPA: F0F1 ATP synthase subunit A [Stellaceae bacterium]|nr:F0F1 ATP synthase subunit A [Stellaceae bacterium]
MHPLEQFKIEPLIPLHIGGLDVSYTNAALFMTIIVVLVTALLVLGTKRGALVPGRWQSIGEMSYEFVADMVDTNSGHGAEPYFPFIFTLFMFVLFANALGLIPYSYTVTSQIIVTFALAIFIFMGVTIVGFAKHGLHFLRFFVPEGVPLLLLVVLVPIEILSYCIRPFTLSVRLFANMLAGHTMLAIFGGFAASVGLLAIFPVAIDVAIYALEVLVAALQAYVFAILAALYLRDALHMH